MVTGSLIADVRSMVSGALERATLPHIQFALQNVMTTLDGPLRIAVVGRPGVGKSTFINAFCGNVLAPTDGVANRIPVWYRYGPEADVSIQSDIGESRAVPFTIHGPILSVDSNIQGAVGASAMVVAFPSPQLSGISLVEPPPNGQVIVDAYVHVTRVIDDADIELLTNLRDAGATALNVLTVISGADTAGGDQLDALVQAQASATAASARLGHLSQSAMPLAGRLAQTAELLGEDEFAAFKLLASAPVDERDELLSTPADFAESPCSVGLAPAVRQAMVALLGMYGVRMAVAKVAEDEVTRAPDLNRELSEASGMSTIRVEVQSKLMARRDVLRARAALLALDAVIDQFPELEGELGPDIERVEAGAHELSEIRLLDDVRQGRGGFDPDEVGEVERLLGAHGPDARARLGLAPDDDDDAVRSAASSAATVWLRKAENPMTSKALSESARVLVRTCEGLAATAESGGRRAE